MTIVVALLVGDGVVLAADSASTLSDGTSIKNVYFNAEKVWNVCKGLPIGAVTYGLGGFAGRSITSLAKDLRERLSKDGSWELQQKNFTIEFIAHRFKEFFYDEHYVKEWPRKDTDNQGNTRDVHSPFGFLIAGYSNAERHAEVWSFEVDETGSPKVAQVFGVDGVGVQARGQPEAISRLLGGYSPLILTGLVNSGIPQADAEAFLNGLPVEKLVHASMPIQDAIDLARYCVEVTAGFVRFTPGAPSVHEPIDIAAITFHEKFRWVSRKHYYDPKLNKASDHGY
jgi:hypothetical protein